MALAEAECDALIAPGERVGLAPATVWTASAASADASDPADGRNSFRPSAVEIRPADSA